MHPVTPIKSIIDDQKAEFDDNDLILLSAEKQLQVLGGGNNPLEIGKRQLETVTESHKSDMTEHNELIEDDASVTLSEAEEIVNSLDESNGPARNLTNKTIDKSDVSKEDKCVINNKSNAKCVDDAKTNSDIKKGDKFGKTSNIKQVDDVQKILTRTRRKANLYQQMFLMIICHLVLCKHYFLM